MISILYIEDGPLNVRLMRRYLEDENVKLIEASTGQRGLEIALNTIPDLILLDIKLPDMDGLDIAVCLRNKARTQVIPIVAITGTLMDREACLAAGCDAYLFKPITKTELLETIRNCLPLKFKREIDNS